MLIMRFLKTLSLSFVAFLLGVWAEQALPGEQNFLQGNILEISMRVSWAMGLCFLAVVVNHLTEKCLSRRPPASDKAVVVFFLVRPKAKPGGASPELGAECRAAKAC
jgi:hypothetical protein